MPLARIDLPVGKPAAYHAAVGEVIYAAMLSALNVPKNDRFQIITEHAEGSLVCSPSYLGIHHGRAPVIVQITLNRGRTIAQKKALYARIADLLFESARVPRADVIVSLVEVEKEDWSFGDGLAPYAVEEPKVPG